MKRIKNINWIKAAGVRAVKTMAQSFIATIGSATVLNNVDWRVALSATILAPLPPELLSRKPPKFMK